MIRRYSLIVLFLLLLIVTARASKISAHRGEVKEGYNFWLAKPDDCSEAKPVFLFLHGASLCGNNLERVRRYGTIDAIEKGRNIDAYVVAPQNPGGSWKPKRLMNILDWVKTNCNVDTTRIYVLGMSLGGYGVIDFTATYPDEVAAAMACCGGGSVRDLTPLNNVPLWIIHGTADRAVNISQSDKVVDAMKKADKTTPRLIYNRVPGWNHGQPARLFYLPETYDWFLSHTLADDDRPVAEGFGITQELMRSAYKGLNTTGSTSKKATKKKGSRKTSSAKKRSRRKSSRR